MSSGKSLLKLAAAMAVLSLAGCGGGGSGGSSDNGGPGGPPDGVSSLTVDATSSSQYAYLNLDTGEVLALSDEDADASMDWHVGLRRFNVKLNGGSSGPGAVAAALVGPQAHFYDDTGDPISSVFFNATPESELDALMAEFDEPASSAWVSDRVETVLRGTSDTSDDGWYIYDDFVNGHMSPNPNNGWLLKSGEGNSYARMRMTELTFRTRAGAGVEHFRFEFDVQPQGTSQFTTTAVFEAGGGEGSGDPAIPPGGGELCFDFDADAIVDCTGTAWDLKIGFVGRDFFLRSNGGVSGDGNGAAFGPFEWTELETYTSATADPSGTPLTSLYQQDHSSGIFSSHDWYAYNLTGMHQLHPNYRVYLIDTDTDDPTASRYAMQIINYYDDAGNSGHVTLRYRAADAPAGP